MHSRHQDRDVRNMTGVLPLPAFAGTDLIAPIDRDMPPDLKDVMPLFLNDMNLNPPA